MARLAGPSGLSEDEKVQLAAKVIRRAIDSGRTEMLVYRFPNQLCTDHGRAINQREPGWEKTLTISFGTTTSARVGTRSSSRSSIGRADYPATSASPWSGAESSASPSPTENAFDASSASRTAHDKDGKRDSLWTRGRGLKRAAIE